MDTQRFDRLATTFASRFSRRDSIKLSGVGLGAAALGGMAFHQSATAQDATPDPARDNPTSENLGLPQGERTYTMFVQTASSGTWAPKAGEDGVYTLTLSGLPAQTVYFSDRPSRLVGTQTTTEFLQALGFPSDNPPNAALVTSSDQGQDILVIELFNPEYNEEASGATLVYSARTLDNYLDTNLGGVAELQDDRELPAAFDGASLFIDDCGDGSIGCVKNNRDYGDLYYGCCYKFPVCHACWDIIRNPGHPFRLRRGRRSRGPQ